MILAKMRMRLYYFWVRHIRDIDIMKKTIYILKDMTGRNLELEWL
jgi:hypothetical protein